MQAGLTLGAAAALPVPARFARAADKAVEPFELDDVTIAELQRAMRSAGRRGRAGLCTGSRC